MTSSSSNAAIEDVAIAWLAERDDGFSAPREREFTQWLRADPRHAAAVARLEQTLGLLHELPAFRAELNTVFDRAAPVVPFSVADVPPTRERRGRPRWLVWSGIAAAFAVAGITSWRVLPHPSEVSYATTVAGYQRARLDDGSTVELNSASAVRVRFTAAERHINLETGEAHFDVAHDTLRPFVVHAAGVFVRAVGTAFNVRLSPDGAVEVIVSNGKVRVGHGVPNDQAAAPLVSAGERLLLPKQVATPAIEKVTPEAMRTAFAWQGRLATFDDAPLAEVVARFNARSRIQLIVTDPELRRSPIGGTFALDESEAFVRMLEQTGGIVGERRGSTEILLRPGR